MSMINSMFKFIVYAKFVSKTVEEKNECSTLALVIHVFQVC